MERNLTNVWTLNGRNVNHVYPLAVQMFKQKWNCRDVVGRGGLATIDHNGPVTTTYHDPCERVLFDPIRDANPYFHFFEALWILAGREDVKWIAYFLKNLRQFSDDGSTFHGAYGERLRHHWFEDQLKWLIGHFVSEGAGTRRAVLGIWDVDLDHIEKSKDIPCNDMLSFKYRSGWLDLSVFCRSNDMVWGAYGANVVQFSTILEYVAGCMNTPVGAYTQISDSFHVYDGREDWERIKDAHSGIIVFDPYEAPVVLHGQMFQQVKPFPLFTGLENNTYTPQERQSIFDDALARFMDMTAMAQDSDELLTSKLSLEFGVVRYFSEVATPLFNSYLCYKARDIETAYRWLDYCKAKDWAVACSAWIARHQK